MDVSCNDGLVVFLDGWEMNGKIFPSAEDHHLPMKERFAEMCTSANIPGKRFVRSRRFVSSQNAALIQYKVSQIGEGFAFRVRYIRNPEPCNILMSDIDGIFTLSNFGKERNCSLTTLLFPANFRVLEMGLGQEEEKECCVGGSDLVEFGGASDLQSNNLLTKQTLCGCDAKRVVGNKGLTVLCGSSTVRMVSSGLHTNRISVFAKMAADEADLDMDNNLLLMCPDFM